MKEVGTLKELGVNAGDVVEYVSGSLMHGTRIGSKYTISKCGLLAIGKDGHNNVSDCTWIHRIISRATPKLWRDMTPEEKGALLLAAHEGKVIEFQAGTNWRVDKPGWYDYLAYRIKPEPKVEVVDIYIRDQSHDIACKKIGTINLIDGKPDCESVKMEPR